VSALHRKSKFLRTELSHHLVSFTYMARKSTDTALHVLVGKIEKALYNKEYALGVFLDIEGAFNKASTDSLLNGFTFKKMDKLNVIL